MGFYFNAMWMVIVTMTTVGYGDYFPQTVLGRVVIFMVCIWGIFIISLMVIALNNTLSLNELESKSSNLIIRLVARGDLRKIAEKIFGTLIQISFIFKGKESADKLNAKTRNLKNLLNEFKEKKR